MFNSFSRRLEKSTELPQKARHDSTELDGNALFEALICEFHWASLQIGGVCQIFNAASENGRAWVLRSCRNILPVEASVVGVALRRWSDIALVQSQAKALSRIYFNLADARARTDALLDNLPASHAAPLPLARIEQFAVLWRQLAEDCAVLIQELEPQTRWRLSSTYSENTLVLSKHLRAAVRGGTTCLDAHANVSLPVLPQRRREPRITLAQPCRLSVRNQSIFAMTRDISRSGMGITCKFELRLREAVLIESRNGRRFAGYVVWMKNGDQGIQFDEPLSPTDPLLVT